ncbi:MFS transporter [Microbacterium aerolatum]|uniref:MFS transporter n=1 Tax=Microbacterium aerolatum TaxID=153731 RepID=UPI00384F6777
MREDILSGATIFLFSIGLGMATVLVPLLASSAGYSLGAVGFLIGVSAITQIIARAGMGRLMDRFSTRSFILVSLSLLTASCLLLALTDTLWAFVVSQLLQGAGRAYFFTGTQTHVIRGSRPAVSALTIMNVTNGVGLLVGPIVAGFVGGLSLTAALYVSAIISGLALPLCAFLKRYEPFVKRDRYPGERVIPLWRRPGVVASGWMGAAAGAWRGILNSYLPVLVTAAGHSIPVAGMMTTLANLAALGGSAAAPLVRRFGARSSAVVGTVLAAGGVAVMVYLLSDLIWAGVFLVTSGLGAGILQTLGPALGSQSVGPEERGRAIAMIGTFRAVSLLITPMSIGALIFVLPSAALATSIVALLSAVPALFMRLGAVDRE